MASTLRTWTLRWFTLLLGSLLLNACASSPADTKVDFTLSISAADNINPDFQGAPSSVVVQVYQLTSAGNFQDALYEDLFNGNASMLGSQLISMNNYLIDPGSNQNLETEISADTKFIGVAVGYREINLVTWKVVQPIADDSLLDSINLFASKGMLISIEQNNVRVSTN